MILFIIMVSSLTRSDSEGIFVWDVPSGFFVSKIRFALVSNRKGVYAKFIIFKPLRIVLLWRMHGHRGNVLTPVVEMSLLLCFSSASSTSIKRTSSPYVSNEATTASYICNCFAPSFTFPLL
jgi:hypothetical protein